MLVTSNEGEREEQLLNQPLLPPGVLRPFILVTGLFFLWGIPNSMNDVLIRQFMKSFPITRFEAGLVQSAFYCGYFFLALPAGIVMKRFGYKAGLIAGLGLFATGCFLFLPAANSNHYQFFLIALFVVASGLAFLETASNPFVAELGPAATSERRLNLAQAFNPVGYFLGVVVGTFFIFSGIELSSAEVAAKRLSGTYDAYTHSETLRVVAPYLILGTLALIWAIMIASTKFPEFLRRKEAQSETGGSWRVLASQKHFVFAVVAQFLYCGAQTCAWSYFIQYAREYGGVADKRAGLLLACTIFGFGVGRFASTLLMKRFAPARIMAAYAVINACLLLAVVLLPGWVGISAAMATGFFFSLMFPTIFALGIKDLGPNTKLAASMIVMAIVGGAVLTPLMGYLAEVLHSTARSYLLPVVGNLGIAAFAIFMLRYQAHKPETSSPQA